MEQKPSVGRMVHYRPIGSRKDQPYPAVITHVWSDMCVNLCVLNDGSFTLEDRCCTPTSVTHGNSEGEWSWPPRQ